ncbi:MAG TPA: hypothetical protein VK399_02590, partial [Longimicrobiaceae bacterium]|nr:hypothetical protein [Longimicrobiaceae bacterium]
LWGLNPQRINLVTLSDHKIPSGNNTEIRHLFRIFFDPAHDTDTVVALYPDEYDNRMLMQSAVFTIHIDATPLENFDFSVSSLLRITIPAAAKPVIFKELKGVGITRSTLFPDLQNLAADLVSRY